MIFYQQDQPALEITFNQSTIPEYHLHIGDVIVVNYTVRHASTTEDEAKNVKIFLNSPNGNLELALYGNNTAVNKDQFKYNEDNAVFRIGKLASSTIYLQKQIDKVFKK